MNVSFFCIHPALDRSSRLSFQMYDHVHLVAHMILSSLRMSTSYLTSATLMIDRAVTGQEAEHVTVNRSCIRIKYMHNLLTYWTEQNIFDPIGHHMCIRWQQTTKSYTFPITPPSKRPKIQPFLHVLDMGISHRIFAQGILLHAQIIIFTHNAGFHMFF